MSPPSPKREGLKIHIKKSPSLLGEGDNIKELLT
jgi:hypothetical protein